MKCLLPIIGIACVVLASGCESDSGKGAAAGALAGTKWRLSAWSVSSLDPARFTGTAAVNTYGGAYTATADGAFSVGELRSTLMGGSEEAMRAESLYFDLLRQARKHAVDDATLTLRNEGNADLLIFRAR